MSPRCTACQQTPSPPLSQCDGAVPRSGPAVQHQEVGPAGRHQAGGQADPLRAPLPLRRLHAGEWRHQYVSVTSPGGRGGQT